MKRSLWVAVAVFCFCGIALAEDEGVDLTVYNQGFALVRDRRNMELASGTSILRFSDVAANIEPTSVHFKSLTDEGSCRIEEQNYEYDLVNSTKLLSKYIDKKIKVLTADGAVHEGVLMSADSSSIVLSNPDTKQIDIVSYADNIRTVSFPELPEGLITKPTLMWQLSNNKAGRHLTEVSYLTQGVSWSADYVAVVDKDDRNIDLSGWVTLDNRSGVTYKNAGLKLIAGDVHRAEPEQTRAMYDGMARAKSLASESSFQEKSFFEYHMYTLQRRTTVKNNQTKQVSLLNAGGVPVTKLFIFDPAKAYGWYYYQEGQSPREQKVQVKLEVTNSQKNNLGMPLPRGKVKVYKKDSDGKLEFIGEDSIDHTPRDEKIRLFLGDAFDVVGERKRMDFKQYGNTADERIEVSLRNHKDENISVTVVEHLWRYMNWEIKDNNVQFVKKDAQTVEYTVTVPRNGETKISYTAHYWW